MPYTSASSLANVIEYQGHLHTWEKRYLARGMGLSPDLCMLAAAEPYNTGLTNPVTGPAKTASGRRLDEIIERALDRAGIHEKADYGTAVHAWTEPANDTQIAAQAQRDVDSFHQCLKDHGMKIVATEVFTANDHVQAAGTFDHLIWAPGLGYVIADKKTGRMNWHHFGVQLSVYARGEVYDPQAETRAPLESLTKGLEVNRGVGLVFEIKNGKTRVRPVDLMAGWRGACVCAAARDYKSMTLEAKHHLEVIADALAEVRADLADRLRAATTREERLALWENHKHVWTDDLTRLAQEGAA